MPFSKRLLQIAGLSSLAVALFQVALGLSPVLSAYFGAPPELLTNPAALLIASLVVALIFAIWGLYGLSGAGLFRRSAASAPRAARHRRHLHLARPAADPPAAG